MNERSGQELYERIPTKVFEDAQLAVGQVARELADAIRKRQFEGNPFVLGLATGSTPVPLYRELVRLHREEGLSFANVTSFNLDEYFGIDSRHPESYYRFMREQLFDHIDMPEEQINIPQGSVEREEVFEACQAYEEKIAACGGIDVQILGIGRTGHIGFNEPGSGPNSRTRLVTLDRLTRLDAARDFQGEHNVPRYAVTMGVGTIMDARKVYLLAWGRSKAEVVKAAVEDAPVESLPASFLQAHKDVSFILDTASASELTRCKYPWLVGFPEWTPELVRKSVTHLSLKLGKPLLKLVDKDYQENGLSELVTEQGPAYGLNIRVFNEVQHTITGWPGGKPDADDTYRPERASPARKRVLVLSPEPQDDVLSMAATLSRLAAHGHELTVAYLTSGNLGVPDEEANWAADLMLEAGDSSLASEVLQELEAKGAFSEDSPKLRKFKSYIRRNEARASLEMCGLGKDCIRFLDLPFYENGRYRRFEIGEADVAAMRALIQAVKPHQIFVTGEAADPSSVQAKSFSVFEAAIRSLSEETWFEDCYVWLYRSDGREWEIHQVEMSVPCSPDEAKAKAQAIYQHRSQRSQLPVMNPEQSEAWEQAIQRNRETAALYDKLGLAEYEAIECFVRWNPRKGEGQ
ncbi:glucosamine-6-phosphate deaminase [Pelagicoccus sp. SDUM812005]|uniref:glucosamine-6-phosphate deaminase n=1 Tax=Pelagicoccus sp. SDUM812005 TaxID=3041257 RepID=UPI00280CE56D|nr:glucosamine-6-phosphate deaminase [Pelagicoccus sp. SDUM812005]MDQ8181511.1 glucosamine-6-phosphate deaminase [Pelagicoccus sp. SDUM812005]